jgi:hypothetical protein
MTNLVRLTVNLTKRSDAALQLASDLTGDSKTDTVNRALQVYAYLAQQSQASGPAKKIRLVAPDGTAETVSILL